LDFSNFRKHDWDENDLMNHINLYTDQLCWKIKGCSRRSASLSLYTMISFVKLVMGYTYQFLSALVQSV